MITYDEFRAVFRAALRLGYIDLLSEDADSEDEWIKGAVDEAADRVMDAFIDWNNARIKAGDLRAWRVED